jgi:hypothetical protein
MCDTAVSNWSERLRSRRLLAPSRHSWEQSATNRITALSCGLLRIVTFRHNETKPPAGHKERIRELTARIEDAIAMPPAEGKVRPCFGGKRMGATPGQRQIFPTYRVGITLCTGEIHAGLQWQLRHILARLAANGR